MKLSRNFVSDYVDIDVDSKTLAEDMTSIGNEYDSCSPLIPATNLIIGEVVECKDHPDSDHLHVCKVNVGEETLQIICGAPNVRENLKVIVALEGAVLPGGVIKKGKIRGEESNGMLCSMAELGLEHKFLKEADIAGIHELPSDAPVGENPIKYLELDDDVIDFELTSNRGDLLSILGMAYEIGALYDKEVKEIDLSYNEIDESIKGNFNLSIETENCPLFLVKKVKNVTIKESPIFIKNRLIASGIRPINNVVDISNYVMLETGQPLHFYDADKLNNELIVRMAKENEELMTLDGEMRVLSESDIVIANKENAIGLAGVMGGFSTEITENTKNIIIEAAIFHPTFIRKTSKRILRSEASNRFEKGLDPKRTYMAIERSCNLLEKYADSEIVKDIVEYNKLSMEDKKIEITLEKINKVLGITLDKETVLNIFKRLNFKVNTNNDTFTVEVPSRRCDISIQEDLIEEVGRIYGIDKIEGKKMTLPIKPGYVNKDNRYIRNKLSSLGLNETLSYALIRNDEVNMFTNDEFECVKVLDPMSEEKTTLRYSLLPSLLNIYKYNKARGEKDICIYEIGKGFYKKDNEYHEEDKLAILMTGDYFLDIQNEKVDFYVLKGVLEELLESLGYKNRYSIILPKENLKDLHPGQSAEIILNNQKIGIMGRLHPNISKDAVYVLEINLKELSKFRVKKMQYKEISKYPSVSKDIAFIMPKGMSSGDVQAVIKRAGGKLLTDIRVFDVFEGESIGENNKSIAYALTFQDDKKTLSDEEVMEVFNKIIDEVTKKLNIKLRDE